MSDQTLVANSEVLINPIEITRAGGDEMNLVEYPFASLWGKEKPGMEIEHEWETRHPITGKTVRASWRVTGDPKLGLPGPSDERLYLVLVQLTREAGLESQTVHFTRHDLVKRMGWSHDQHSYRILMDVLRRLKAVTISAENAFWDARAKTFRTVGFSVLDNYDVADERPGRKSGSKEGQAVLPLSYFKWNDVIFNSMRAGYIRSLDLNFALALKGDIALRLYRYLDKKSYDGRRTFEIELAVLCERHLGMRRSPYASKYKERLKPAHDELMERGFLNGVEYEAMKSKKAEKVRYAFSPRRDSQIRPAETSHQRALQPTLREKVTPPPETEKPEVAETSISSSSVVPEASPESAQDASLLQQMIDLKVSPDVARQLLTSTPKTHLLSQLNCLADREPKDPAATFVKAVREQWEPPAKYFERQEAAEHTAQSKREQESAVARKAVQQAKEREEQAATEREAAQLDKVWASLDDRTRERIEKEAVERLGILGQTGRAQAALSAMRRSLLREMLQRLHNDAE